MKIVTFQSATIILFLGMVAASVVGFRPVAMSSSLVSAVIYCLCLLDKSQTMRGASGVMMMASLYLFVESALVVSLGKEGLIELFGLN